VKYLWTKPQKFSKGVETFLVVIAFMAVLIIATVQPLDGDTWWHLRAGEVSYEQGRPLTIDVFSYTRFGESWSSHAWLTEVWLYLSFLLGGFSGLSAWICLMAMLAALLMYLQMEGPPVFRAMLIIMAALLLLPFYKARPQMVTLVCLLLVALILDRYRCNKKDLLIWLIPLFILWANMHGGFVIGFIYIIIVVVSDLIDAAWNKSSGEKVDKQKLIHILVVFAICLVAVMIHPLGVKVWYTLVNTLSPGAGSEQITEWASPDFHAPGQQLYLWLALGIASSLALSPRRVNWVDLSSIVFFTASGFIWQRQLSFLVAIGLIIASRYAWPLIEDAVSRLGIMSEKVKLSLTKIRADMEQIMPRSVYWIFLVTAFIVFGTVLFKIYFINTDNRITQSVEKAFPRQAMHWIKANSPEGYMMNSYNWGGYFDWYLRDYPVFIDSRADLFGDEIIGQWLMVMNAREGWQETLTRWNVTFIVTEPGWRIVDILPFYGWEELYRDDQAVIFGRTPSLSTQN
jgi:hypothetical protein